MYESFVGIYCDDAIKDSAFYVLRQKSSRRSNIEPVLSSVQKIGLLRQDADEKYQG